MNLTRSEWSPYEPRTISTVFLSIAYVFVFLHIISLMRTSKTFGPLQITLAKIFVNVLQFICMFGLILFAFALALTQLYRYYGISEDGSKLCTITKDSMSNSCKPAKFSGLGNSLIALFWSLFGYIDVSNDLYLNGTQPLVELFGKVVIATYHITAIIILINMLIAMMAKSFDVTSENKDTEWKFYRTVVWIRFLRREIVRPPPMNIIPNFRWICHAIKDGCCLKMKAKVGKANYNSYCKNCGESISSVSSLTNNEIVSAGDDVGQEMTTVDGKIPIDDPGMTKRDVEIGRKRKNSREIATAMKSIMVKRYINSKLL